MFEIKENHVLIDLRTYRVRPGKLPQEFFTPSMASPHSCAISGRLLPICRPKAEISTRSCIYGRSTMLAIERRSVRP